MGSVRGTAKDRWMALYLGVMATAVGVVAAIGVFGRGDGTTEILESVRGESYEVITTGIYAWNSERIVAEGVGWDIVTLFLVVPTMLFLLRGIARRSLRARLLAVGLLAYFSYQYLMYAMAWAVGPLLLPFVAIYAGSLIGIAWLVSTIPVGRLPSLASERFPRRAMAMVCVLLALILLGMWVPMIADVLGGQLEDNLLGQTTMVVQALDLGIIVPLAMATAVLIWRRHAVGYLLAATLAVKGFAMGTAISAMVLSAWRVEGELEVGGLVIFATAAIAFLVLMVAMLRAIDEEPATATPDRIVQETPIPS